VDQLGKLEVAAHLITCVGGYSQQPTKPRVNGALLEGSPEVYEIQGRLYEEHDKYRCYLEVWACEGDAKQRMFNVWEEHLTPPEADVSEHGCILHLVMEALRRNSQNVQGQLL
jgi:hypothetical protein